MSPQPLVPSVRISVRHGLPSLSGIWLLILILSLACDSARSEEAQITNKILEDFSGKAWTPSIYSAAPGEGSLLTERAPGVESGGSLKVNIAFSGQGFEHFTIGPVEPLVIPGNARKLTLRVKRSDGRLPVKVMFADGWNRTQVDGKNLAWETKLEKNSDWQTLTFDIPGTWVRPVAITGVSTHNFEFKSDKKNAEFLLGGIGVETDVSGIDPATGLLQGWSVDPAPADAENALTEAPRTPLVEVKLSTSEQANIFSNQTPAVTLQVQNWNPGVMEGKAAFRVTDEKGVEVQTWEEPLRVEQPFAKTFPIKTKKYGIYTVAAKITWADETTTEKTLTLAKVPVLPEPTEAQKVASPYGLNYHGGGNRLFEAFKKSGIYWYRDYAFRLEQLRRAKGADRSYKGWPNFPLVLGDYERLGLICLPVLNAVEPPTILEGKTVHLGPDRQWVLDMAEILVSFPKLRFWELGNEYDLGHALEERAVNWENYNLYHKKFGELVALLGDGQLTAVEQGRAGVYPVFVEDAVRQGFFDDIHVVNSHHYTGTEPPETNNENFNSGQRLPEGRRPGSFFDTLRMTKRAAQVDGKKREHWLTEFGWDTLAGPVVTPEQQAAYLQRGFLLSFAAGTDKSFWFYNFDEDEAKASRFFDGCGLITHHHEPKLSFAAMAGLSAILPRPLYVGSINAGPSTAGYVFENDGKLVAGLWTINDEKGPRVTFQADELFDYLGNKAGGLSAELQMAPVYAVGLKKSDPLYAQTAYDIDSNHMIVVSPSDTAEVTVLVANNREQLIEGKAVIVPPSGWTSLQENQAYSVAPGAAQELTLKFSVPPEQANEMTQGRVEFQENGKLVKSMPLVIKVQQPFSLEVSPLEGRPGLTTTEVLIENRSAQVQGGTVSLKLPSTWKADVLEFSVENIKPGERRSQKMDFTWSEEWKSGETAIVGFESSKGVKLEAPIIPNRFPLAHAKSLKMDADLKDWPADSKLPEWMLGSSREDAEARLWLAWAPEGLYGAVEVKNSLAQVKNPREFWAGDALELFLSTDPKKTKNVFEKGDHQFWFVPLFDENRVYVGQWQGADEIPETKFDLPGIQSAARKTVDGYIMEFLLPAAAFQYFSPAAGQKFGVNANLSIIGPHSPREVFWPRKKDLSVRSFPLSWGRMKLSQ